MITTIRVRRLVAGPALILSLLGTFGDSPAADPPELRCRRAIESSLAKWALQGLKLRQRCQDEIAVGLREPSTDCVSGSNEPGLARALAEARHRLESRLASACGEANWGLLSFPGPCPDSPSFGASSLASCIESVGGGAIGDLFESWYPSPMDNFRGAEAECVRILPRRAAAMVLRETRARLRCLAEAEQAGNPAGIDCRGQLVPYGFGTGDEAFDVAVARAQKSWTAGMPKPCSTADFEEMGFGPSCPDPGGDGVGIVDFHTCVFRANRQEVPVLLDLAFPSDPVCGNGILQEGEVCDEGAANSDTVGDACRTDCTLPACGDGTTDPASDETCDDGNFTDLDGCTGACVLEFCGDGTVNDLPDEACDDGNTNPNDRCTGTCKVASCGDGVVCNDPSCTSGPGGGPELCDFGAGNTPGGQCDTTCYGFARDCTLTIGITNAVTVGAITYEMSYRNADGEVVGQGSTAACRSRVTGGLFSFFDNETRRNVRESLIVNAGFTAPAAIAECDYLSNDFALAPADFTFTVLAASDPAFNDITVNLAVTAIDCEP